MFTKTLLLTALVGLGGEVVWGHEHSGSLQEHLSAQGPHRERLWYNVLPGDGGTQVFFFFFFFFHCPLPTTQLRK